MKDRLTINPNSWHAKVSRFGTWMNRQHVDYDRSRTLSEWRGNRGENVCSYLRGLLLYSWLYPAIYLVLLSSIVFTWFIWPAKELGLAFLLGYLGGLGIILLVVVLFLFICASAFVIAMTKEYIEEHPESVVHVINQKIADKHDRICSLIDFRKEDV